MNIYECVLLNARSNLTDWNFAQVATRSCSDEEKKTRTELWKYDNIFFVYSLTPYVIIGVIRRADLRFIPIDSFSGPYDVRVCRYTEA